MALVPLSVTELERLISSSGKPTGAQYATYWGRTAKERYGRFVESATVGFLGVFFSYFFQDLLPFFFRTFPVGRPPRVAVFELGRPASLIALPQTLGLPIANPH